MCKEEKCMSLKHIKLANTVLFIVSLLVIGFITMGYLFPIGHYIYSLHSKSYSCGGWICRYSLNTIQGLLGIGMYIGMNIFGYLCYRVVVDKLLKVSGKGYIYTYLSFVVLINAYMSFGWSFFTSGYYFNNEFLNIINKLTIDAGFIIYPFIFAYFEAKRLEKQKSSTKNRIIGAFIVLLIYVIGASVYSFQIREYIENKEHIKEVESLPEFIKWVKNNEYTEEEIIKFREDRGFGNVNLNINNKDVLEPEDYDVFGDDYCLSWRTDVICSEKIFGDYVGKNLDEKHEEYYWRYEAYPKQYWDIYIDNDTIYAEYENYRDNEHILVYENEYRLVWDYEVDKFYKVAIKEGIEDNTETIIVDRIDARILKELMPKG